MSQPAYVSSPIASCRAALCGDACLTAENWAWQGYRIRYQSCGDTGPAVLCVHGFGGNCAHWRKNLPVLGMQCRAYAIDLLGYGYSDKPDPK